MTNRSRSIDRARRQRGITRAVSEALEPRRMLAFIFGTSGNDNITISASGGLTHINVNGVLTSTADTSILVLCDEGNDLINVSSTRSGTDIEVRGENGNDTVAGGNDLDAVFQANFTFDGGEGTDDLVANNMNDSTTAATIDIQDSGILKNLSFLVRYKQIDRLVYYDSSASNRISFINLNLSGQTNDIDDVTVKGNGGDDIFANYRTGLSSAGYWPTSIPRGEMRVDGGPGNDTVLLSNFANIGGTYTVEPDRIDVTSSSNDAGFLTYLTCELVDFLGNSNNDFVILKGKPSSTALRFDSENGGDTFQVGGGDIDTNGFLLANTTLVGGAGTDSIRFDDELDTSADGTTSSYTFGVFTLTKGAVGFNYSSFESQILNSADGFVSGLNTVPTINIDALSGQLDSTTINAGPGRGSIINVTQNNLINLSGTLNLNQGGPFSVVNINDQNSLAAPNTYEVNKLQFRKINGGQTINYSGVKQMTLNSSGVNDTVNVIGTPAGMSLTLNSGTGNDNFSVGSGDVDVDLLGSVLINGGAGSNVAVINNASDTALESQTLNGATFIDGFSHTFNSLDTLTINGGPGGTNFVINGAAHKTFVNGGSGNDTFSIGGGDIDSNFLSGLTLALVIDGNGGTDSVFFNDLNDPNLNSYFINTTRLDLSDAGIHWYVNWSEVEAITLDASNGTSTQPAAVSAIVVEDTVVPLRINGNGGNDWVIVNDAAVPPIIHTGLGDKDLIDINQDFDTVPVTAVIEQNDDVETLDIRASGTLRVTNGATLVKTRAATSPGSMSINGVLDLAGGAFLSRAGGPSLASFQTFLTRGYNGGAWNGTDAQGAINSSLAAGGSPNDAVGYGLGSEIALSTIGGFNIAAGDVLCRYTRYGDTDLNGVVDFDDYSRTDQGFLNGSSGWVNGDFDFNNVIDFDDYALIDQAFLSQRSGLRALPPIKPASNPARRLVQS